MKLRLIFACALLGSLATFIVGGPTLVGGTFWP